MFCCSQYGPLFNNLEDAKRQAGFVWGRYNDGGFSYAAPPIIETLNGWQEEINEDNGCEYVEAAMQIIKDLKTRESDLLVKCTNLEEENESLRGELKHLMDLYEEDWAEIMRDTYGE
jgi:hypothetical protein